MPLIKLHSFRGLSVEEAEEKARFSLGPQLDIHATRAVRRRGFRGLLGASEIEILATRRAAIKAPVASDIYEARRNFISRLETATDTVRNIFDGVSALTTLYEYVLSRGVSSQLAEGMLLSMKGFVPPLKMRDFGFVKESFREYLRKLIRISGGIDPCGLNNVAVMIGPTGSGKTTTVAKLAARMKIDYRLSVALVTTDTFRVGAVDQIGLYADALGTPLKVATDGDSLAEAIHGFADYRVVIVDTAGIGGTSPEKSFLEGMRSAMNRAGRCMTYLLLDMRAHSANQAEVLKKFSPIRIDNLILTKTDECAVHGQILDVLVYTGIPVAYVTNGQNVPGDLRKATSLGVADMILGDGFDSLRQ